MDATIDQQVAVLTQWTKEVKQPLLQQEQQQDEELAARRFTPALAVSIDSVAHSPEVN
jgi:hypothetical protein